eukprot:2933311-Karenia_brevis.AAC.1
MFARTGTLNVFWTTKAKIFQTDERAAPILTNEFARKDHWPQHFRKAAEEKTMIMMHLALHLNFQ